MEVKDLITFEVNGKKCVAFVRKLTERECGRLMGCDDAAIDIIENCGVSRSAQYKIYGNSIVVDVLYYIFRNAFIPQFRSDATDLFGAMNAIRGEWNAEHPLRVATLCSGYDSQFMALDRLERDFPPFKYKRVFSADFNPENKKPTDEQPQNVAHRALFPDCPNLGDITKIDWAATQEKYGEVDMLFYSTPCQSISQAGLQHGFEEGSGTRSSIIWTVRDALRILQPRFACLENVAAMVSQKFKPMFDLWREETDRLGYASFAKLLNAKDYGVPQNRNRIFLFSVHKEKNGGEANYNFPKPFALKTKLKDVLEDSVDTRYYLNPVKVQEFVKKNLVKIQEYAAASDEPIAKMPEELKDWMKGYSASDGGKMPTVGEKGAADDDANTDSASNE